MTISSMYLFQDSSSFLMNYIMYFHDYILVILLLILSIVLYIFCTIFLFPCFSRFFKSSEFLESVWTVIPCFILLSMAAPSLMTLYMSDEVINPLMSVKIIGHQWYWSYEYGDFGNFSFESYMIPSEELSLGGFRLLEVDKSLIIPYKGMTRLIITSDDVIHSWCVPSTGTKMDAVPGRLNQAFILPFHVGKMYGQCSEICGSMHSFMPISVEVVPTEQLINLFSLMM